MQQSSYRNQSRVKLTALVVAVIVIAGVVVLADHLKASGSSSTVAAHSTTSSAGTTTTAPTSGTSTGSTASDTTTTASSGTYKDGSFSAISSYYVPHGTETIQVSLTVKNGVITDSSIVNSESDRDSQSYQEAFTSAYKSSVVGKSISGLQLSVISGASDTTQGFNDALQKIASEAQA